MEARRGRCDRRDRDGTYGFYVSSNGYAVKVLVVTHEGHKT